MEFSDIMISMIDRYGSCSLRDRGIPGFRCQNVDCESAKAKVKAWMLQEYKIFKIDMYNFGFGH